MGVRDDVPYCTLFPFFVFTFLPIKLEIARSEMYHYRICVRRGARLEGVCDLSAIDVGLWGNKACMRSCFPPLNGVFMSLGPCVACRLSEVVDLAWPSCIISLLNHVGCVSLWLTSSTFTYTCLSLSLPLFLSQWLSPYLTLWRPRLRTHTHTHTHTQKHTKGVTVKIDTQPPACSIQVWIPLLRLTFI